MDISAAQKQAKRERIYQERRSGGLCTYCGTAGHFRATCPRRKRRPLAVAEATLTPTAPHVEQAPTAEKHWSHVARLAPPWDDPHLSHLVFVVRLRRKDQ